MFLSRFHGVEDIQSNRPRFADLTGREHKRMQVLREYRHHAEQEQREHRLTHEREYDTEELRERTRAV